MIDEFDNTGSEQEKNEEQENGLEPVKPIVTGNGSFEPNGELFLESALPEDAPYLALPGANNATMQGPVAEQLNSLTEQEITELAKEPWSTVSAEASEVIAREFPDYDPYGRDGSNWNNQMAVEDRLVGIARPKLGKTNNAPLTGVQAMAKALAYTGIGAILQIPLYHTGIWVTIKVPTNFELLELDRLLSLNKQTLGRVTRGKVFSQTDVYLKMSLVNFVLDHVVETTWTTIDRQELKKVIKLPDIDALIHGMATTLYPKGYNFSQPCVGDVKKCHYVATGVVRVDKLFWVDNSVFTDYQRKQIANRTAKIDAVKLEKYQEEFGVKNSAVFSIGDTHFKLTTPSISDFELAGASWISAIQNDTEQAFQQRLSADERDEHIYQAGQTTAMRQYSHWVERVTFRKDGGEDEGWVEGSDEIASLLGIWTSDTDTAEKFYGFINRFISDVTVACCGIPNFTCPSCKARQNNEEGGRFEYLIRVDAAAVFFTLYSHRLLLALAVESI